MPLRTVCFMLSLYVLSMLESVQCYFYQTEPLFLSFSELAALEENSPGETSRFGEHQVNALVLNCHQDSVEVVIKVPQFDPSLPLELWRLGSVGVGQHLCSAKASGDGEFTIRAPLGACGSNLTFTQSSLLYNNLLLLLQRWPPPTTPGDVMQAEAVIPVQCEYPRRYTVSSGPLKPTWSPMFPIRSTYLDLDFHLRLMTADWSSERRSTVYFLDERVNIEASVDPPPLAHLRLYVDSCVATLTSDVHSYPRYPFIDHQGCLIDSQLHGSSSSFMSRVQDRLLRFQLEPFLFHQDPRHTMYITCHLEAVPISNKKPIKRACSFMSGRWRSVDGDDHLCESCSSISKSPHKRELRSKINQRRSELNYETRLGPIIFLS